MQALVAAKNEDSLLLSGWELTLVLLSMMPLLAIAGTPWVEPFKEFKRINCVLAIV